MDDPEAVQEADWAERVYCYQRCQPFAVQQVTTEEGTSTYDYDANGRGVKRSTPGGIERGNMTARMENGVSWTHTYNAENRLASMTNGRVTQWSTPVTMPRTEFADNQTVGVTTWLFSYDGDGTLVGQLVTDGVTATHTAFFMGGGTEVISDGVTETVRKYYSLAGQTFGMSDNGVMKYLISDQLGSTVSITDNTGGVLSETRYMPFGEPRADVGSITQTDKTYTGQRDVPDTGLMDYRARLYSPSLGRFIQPDTIVPGAGNSQAWNRYSYVLNNPITYIDPSGNFVCDSIVDGKCINDSGDKSATTKKVKVNKKTLLTKSPIRIEEIDWLQWFGGTVFAKENGKMYNYHKYCQSYHCGVDFGADWGTDIYAGVNGQITYVGDHKVSIISGNYEILFLHLSAYSVVYGQNVTPDTIIGRVGNTTNRSSDGNNHLHLEIRYSDIELNGYKNRIANPLLYMPPETIQSLLTIADEQNRLANWKDKGVTFANTDSLNPFDQPEVITRMAGNLWKLK